MPTITIPADVVAELPGESPDKPRTVVVSFARDFVVGMLLADQKWGENMDAIFVAMELRTAFKNALSGDKVRVSRDHLAKLEERMRTPSAPYNPIVCVQLGAFFDAILKPQQDD